MLCMVHFGGRAPVGGPLRGIGVSLGGSQRRWSASSGPPGVGSMGLAHTRPAVPTGVLSPDAVPGGSQSQTKKGCACGVGDFHVSCKGVPTGPESPGGPPQGVRPPRHEAPAPTNKGTNKQIKNTRSIDTHIKQAPAPTNMSSPPSPPACPSSLQSSGSRPRRAQRGCH